jgi:ABC-type transporter Mla subunit MlaD
MSDTEPKVSPPSSQPMDDLFALLGSLNPLTNGVKALDQAKRTIDALIASLEMFVQSMDNVNQVATRVNRLLDDVEEPLRRLMPQMATALGAAAKLGDVASALNDLSKRLSPFAAFMPQSGGNKPE